MIKNKIVFSLFFTIDDLYDDGDVTNIPYFLYPCTYVVDCTSTDDNRTGTFKISKEEIKRLLKNLLPSFESIEDLKNITIRISVEKYSNIFENSEINNIYINNIYINNFCINAYRVYKYFNLV